MNGIDRIIIFFFFENKNRKTFKVLNKCAQKWFLFGFLRKSFLSFDCTKQYAEMRDWKKNNHHQDQAYKQYIYINYMNK